MKTVIEAKVFKNGGSNAIRIPAIVKLTNQVVYLEIDEATGDIVIHKEKPQRFTKLIALQKNQGPMGDTDWNIEPNHESVDWPARPSLSDLDEHFK